MIIGLDANSFKIHMDELIHCADGEKTFSSECLDKVFSVGVIPLDEGGFIQNEWESCTGAHANEFIRAWVSDMLAENRIVVMLDKPCRVCRGELSRLGVPQKDAKIMSLMKAYSASYLISHDIDMFEPKAKTHASKVKAEIIRSRAGSVCRHMERAHNVRIMDFQNWMLETIEA